jgi:imidazolonepropionase-like amidohydrolase
LFTTLIAFDVLTAGPDELRVRQQDRTLEDLAPAVRDNWRALPIEDAPMVPATARPFMRKVTAALHRAGVPLVAATDAMGALLVVPGSSLHRELALLTECGLTPYEALRTATVNAAMFLRQEGRFGTLAVDKRADLLLLDANPLENLAALENPAGVMARGRWFTREGLQGQLAALRQR